MKDAKAILALFWALVFVLIVIIISNNYLSKSASQTVASGKAEPAFISQPDPSLKDLSVYSDYVTDGKYIYYNISVQIPDKFKLVARGLGQDGVWVYWNGKRIPIDPKKMRTLMDDYGEVSAVLDDRSVYISLDGKPTLIPNVDAASFSFIKGTSYAKDKNHVYYLTYNGYSDDSSVKVLDQADPNTFVNLGTCASVEMSRAVYAKDSKNVYVEDQIIPEADATTFTVLGKFSVDDQMPASYSYAKDKNNIFYNCGQVLKGVDYATFEYLGNGKAQDKNNSYSLGEYNPTVTKRSQ